VIAAASAVATPATPVPTLSHRVLLLLVGLLLMTVPATARRREQAS